MLYHFLSSPGSCSAPARRSSSHQKRGLRTFSNVIENEDGFELELTVPGFSKEQIEIKVEDHSLIIEGKKEDVEEKSYLRKGFFPNHFKRVFKIPHSIDTDNIAAKVEFGILHIALPKAEDFKARSINIK